MSRYVYYPGCSLTASSRSYEESVRAVLPRLGIELVELRDWNCCGASMAVALGKVLALSLAARNLALAEPTGLPLLTPCPSCKLRLQKAAHALQDGGPLAAQVRDALAAGGVTASGGVAVHHLLDVLAGDEVLQTLRREAKAPLAGLRIAPYYGCQFLRPGDGAPPVPRALERVIEAAGAEVADFPLKAKCCGGALVATQEALAGELSNEVLRSCRAAGATAVVTPCPLCQVTLEMAPRAGRRKADILPVLNLTQMVGLSLGLGRKALGLRRLLTPRRRLRDLAAAAAV